MKKIFALSILAASLTGCVTVPPLHTGAPVVVNKAEYTLTTSYACQNNGFGMECTGFNIDVINKTDKPIKIVWNDTAIIKGNDSHAVLPDGIRYDDATKSKPDTIIPPKGNVSKSFIPADAVHFNASLGWIVSTRLVGGTYNVYVAMNVNGQETGETVAITATEGTN